VEENKETAKNKFSFNFVLAFSGTVLAVLAGLSAMMAGFGSRIGLWHFRTGFDILHFAAYGSIVAVLMAVAGAVFGGKRRSRCLAAAIPGVVIGLAAIALLGNVWIKAHNLPPIHDITTDIANPPQFVALLPLRAGAPNPAVYGGAEIAIKQLQAYPDIRPMVLEVPAEQAYAEALAAARGMGWKIISEDKKDWRMEATDTTFWFGFTDDIAIRVTPAGQRSIIDIRSVSRVGRSDLGKNAERIRDFLARVHRNT
jgi:uncharacterized protein (DUF1499 family)